MKTVQLPALAFRADIAPGSLNVERRTADLIWSTGAPVERSSFWTGERFIESLSLDKGAVRLDRLNGGAPFLNAHSAFALGDVIGVVEPGSARVADGRGMATVRFSRRPDVEGIWSDVRDGILRNVSVGYRVHKYEVTKASDGRVEQRHAVDWEPYEISAVPMGADPGAQIRAEDRARLPTHPCVLVVRGSQEDRTMEPTEQVTEAPAATPETVVSERELGETAAEARIQGIYAAARALNFDSGSEFVQRLITQKLPLEKAQSALLEKFRLRVGGDQGPRPGPTGATVEVDVLDRIHEGIRDAMLHRIDPSHWPLNDNARPYRRKSLLDLVELCLEQRGYRARGLSAEQLARKAGEPMPHLQFRVGLHTTSDFANITADVANKTLRRAYDEAPQTWLPLARRASIPDFKTVKRNQISEAPDLDLVLEHGEFTRGTMSDAKETYGLQTYGKVLGLSRQLLINDDLDAFGRNITAFGRAASRKQSDIVWFQIMRGKVAVMGDGNALFDATNHGNFTDSGTAIDVASLGIGRAAIEKQTGLDGSSYLNLMARYLIVPTDLATLAQQYTTVVQGQQVLTPGQASNVNPFAGALQVISEPRLGATVTVNGVSIVGDNAQWYMAASPDQVDIIEYGFLDGADGPVIETRIGFDVDGVETKCVLDFAAKVLDWRGLYRNDGAGH